MSTDTEVATPALCRIQLASQLRKLRTDAGLKASQVCRRLLWSPSKLTRLESGENAVVEPSDVFGLCQIYGADEETAATLMGYAEVTKSRRDWWQSPKYRPVITPGFKAFLGLEATASGLHNYESDFVPGLLQTESYIRVIHQRAHQGKTEAEVEKLVTIRRTRQEVLRRPEFPLKLTAIVSESVLRRRIGDGALMREQLAHIAELVESLPNLRVQVMPFSAGVHDGMNGKFAVFRFPDAATVRSIIYLESLTDAWVSRREATVTRYTEVFADLQALAPGPQESLTMIKQAIEEH
jgi:transcriptional regulator with XRE-family HTH domain